VLPFPGLTVPWGVAVDTAGNVYVSEHDNNQVLKLPAGSNVPTPLALTGLNTPLQLAVDKDGNIYVADRGNDQAIKFVVANCPS
jgi:serine/threonine-protein kinase